MWSRWPDYEAREMSGGVEPVEMPRDMESRAMAMDLRDVESRGIYIWSREIWNR